jgi:hypothetical protein
MQNWPLILNGFPTQNLQMKNIQFNVSIFSNYYCFVGVIYLVSLEYKLNCIDPNIKFDIMKHKLFCLRDKSWKWIARDKYFVLFVTFVLFYEEASMVLKKKHRLDLYKHKHHICNKKTSSTNKKLRFEKYCNYRGIRSTKDNHKFHLLL